MPTSQSDELRAYQKKWREEHREEVREYQRDWQEKNREHVNEYQREYYAKNRGRYRAYRLARRYGLSVDDVAEMLEAQEGRCAICQRDGIRLVVDHCHESRQVRGLLCDRCNNGLGALGDTAEAVQRAVDYLNAR